MLFRTLSAAVYGIDANLIDVEVDVGEHRSDKENFMTVGLPDAAVRESKQRIQAFPVSAGRLHAYPRAQHSRLFLQLQTRPNHGRRSLLW
jgi:hypothetical protein